MTPATPTVDHHLAAVSHLLSIRAGLTSPADDDRRYDDRRFDDRRYDDRRDSGRDR